MRSQIKANRVIHAPSAADMFAEISKYDRSALVEKWQNFFGTAPAKNTSSSILIRVMAHKVQSRVFGGLSSSSKRALRKELKASYQKQAMSVLHEPSAVNGKPDSQVAATKHPTSQPPLLSAGTQLIREWNGRPYCVEVTDGGFILDGKSYQSLSAIAKKITGTHWSGPRFFGLSTSKPMKASDAIAGAATGAAQ
jgi:hypothetical protein